MYHLGRGDKYSDYVRAVRGLEQSFDLPPLGLLSRTHHHVAAAIKSMLFVEAFSHETIERMGRKTAGDLQVAFSALLHWRDQGMPLVAISESLTAALLLTSAPEQKIVDIALPFHQFLIKIPSGTLIHGSYDVRIISFSCSREIVNGVTATDACEPLDVEFVRSRWGKDKSTLEGLEGTYVGPFLCISAIDTRTTEGTFWYTAWPGEIPISKWISETATKVDDENEIISRAFLLCFNLMSYISSLPPSDPSKTKLLRPKARGESGEVSFDLPVNHPVRLIPNLVDLARSTANMSAKERAAFKIKRRFMVRGHWRNQAAGVKLSERIKTWIHPHWKGPTGAEALTRIYEATDERLAHGRS